MSYWGSYEDQLNGGYPLYHPEYVQYYNNMPYYNDQPRSSYGLNNGFNFFNGQAPYQANYLEQPGPSQVTSSDNFTANREVGVSQQNDSNKNTGSVKKKSNDKNRYWNNKKNDKYGSGRMYNNRPKADFGNRNRVEHRRAVPETAEFVNNMNDGNAAPEASDDLAEEVREQSGSRAKGKTSSKQGDGKGYYQFNKRRSNYDDRKNNYRNRDNRYESYDNRSYSSKYGKSSNRYYDSNNDYGASGGRDDYPREKNNWRRFQGNGRNKCNNSSAQKKLDAASQRERLEQMLSRRMLECLVCCERIRHTDKIWSCEQCYHILHLDCVVAWAVSSKLDTGWRCPACQNVCSEVPKRYTCYCGKTQEPRPLPGVVPHACGEPCMKRGRTCDHKCPILCHPGPCPDCNAMVTRPCGCGATEQTVKCSADTDIICDGVCGKLLCCGVHSCRARCHGGECAPCEHALHQVCHCGKVGRKVACTEEFKGATSYTCGEICGKTLSCGNHQCAKVCHEGECEPCDRDVTLVQTCPCGRTELTHKRVSCLDPIPCCDKICAKLLRCGQPAAPHSCKEPCHEGPCPPCPLTTLVRCRCGHMGKDLPCVEVTTKADDARCEKKCTKKRLCGKHRCNQRCCIEAEHVCPLPCNHLLACGHHRCPRTCHSGRCYPCVETSFEELYCDCGANVLYPPIPCGTKPPTCTNPCPRPRACGHEANHNCHIGACPPCTVLCKRWCHGKHEQRPAIPCYQEDFGCGLPCGKQMPCEAHRCEKLCHLGPCPLPCKQGCTVKRAQCGHNCGVPCHRPPCPETPCRESVPVSCVCGLQKGFRPCLELADEYREMEMAHLKDKMADLLKDQPVDISDIVNRPKKPAVLKILECNEECRVLERNRRLAIGLQIRNPDLSQKLTPRYSDFMRGWAKKDPAFCQKVHDKLTELVQLAKQSKQKSRSYSFESMNRDKRHFVHEYCEHFGCESTAYDQEPNRNIVATAFKEKSWLPSVSLLEFIRRENGQRKVPGPILSKGPVGKSETVALKLPGRPQRPASPPKEAVDYFENPPM